MGSVHVRIVGQLLLGETPFMPDAAQIGCEWLADIHAANQPRYRDTLDTAFLWSAFFGVYADAYAVIDPMPELMDGVRMLVAYEKRCMSDTRRFALQPTDSDVLIVLYPGFYVPGCMPTPTSNKTESFLLGARN